MRTVNLPVFVAALGALILSAVPCVAQPKADDPESASRSSSYSPPIGQPYGSTIGSPIGSSYGSTIGAPFGSAIGPPSAPAPATGSSKTK
jgi:hypothetical protein